MSDPAPPPGRPSAPGWQRFLAELKRRRVFRVAAVYGIVAFGVLQVADVLVPALQLPELFTTGIAVLAILGFPIALVLAWAFETTPEGVRRTEPASAGEIEAIVAEPRARRWPAGIAALVGGALLATAGWWALEGRLSSGGRGDPGAGGALGPERGGRATLAVLPFENLSADLNTQPFTDGLHDDLLTQLSKIGSLTVISRSSVREYRDSERSPREIAAELGVGSVLVGGVQRAGDRLRINVRLLDAASEAQLWAEQYGGDLTVAGIFEIQSEITSAIASALEARVTAEERAKIGAPPTEELEAYERFLQAVEYFRRGFAEADFRSADRLAASAIEKDSAFGEAYALRSVARSMLYWFHFDRAASVKDSALAFARRALELRPESPESHWALAHYYYRVDLDYGRALAEAETARRARPGDAEFVALSGDILRRKGDVEEALRRYRRAVELDPRSGSRTYAVGETLILLRRYDEAEPWLRRATELLPDLALPYVYLARLRIQAAGDTAGARAQLEELRSLGVVDEERDFTTVDVALIAGHPDAALAELREEPLLIDNQFRYVPSPLFAGLAWRLKGDSARALAAFDSARAVLERRVSADPSEPRYRSSLGLALAGLGRAEAAIREAEEGVRLMPPEREAWRGTERVLFLARVYAMTGHADAAVERLAHLLALPGPLSVWELRLDPMWDPLRGKPGFQRLIR